MKDAQDLATAQSANSRDALKMQGQALITLANQFDGSAAAATNLATAQHAYYQSLVQLLAGIQQMKADLDSMFNQTRQHIETAGLSPQDSYNFLQRQYDQLNQQLQSATSPDVVQNLVKQMNDDLNQAFDLLSPDQQASDRSTFLARVDALNTEADTRLNAISTAIAAEAGKPFQVVADKLGDAADKIAAAADKQADAADRIGAAADRLSGSSPGGSTVIVIGNPAARGQAGV